MNKLHNTIYGLAAVLLLTLSVDAAAQATRFRARLSEVPVTPADYLEIRGVGEVFAELNGTTLRITGTFSEMTSAAAGAHIHLAPMAMNGPPIHTLQVSNAPAGEISGEVTLTAEQVQALQANSLYIMVHTEKHPGGVIRGWLLPREAR